MHAREPLLKIGGTYGIREQAVASSPSSASKRYLSISILALTRWLLSDTGT